MVELTDRQKWFLIAYLRLTEEFQSKPYPEIGRSLGYPEGEVEEIVNYFNSDEAGLLECGSHPMARLTTAGRQRARLIFQSEGSGIEWSQEERDVILELDEMVRSAGSNSLSRPKTPKFDRVLTRLQAERFLMLSANGVSVFTELRWEAAAIRRRVAEKDRPAGAVESIRRRAVQVDTLSNRLAESGVAKLTAHPLVTGLIIGGVTILVAFVAVKLGCHGEGPTSLPSSRPSR
jgi:hypothetical protein